VSIKKCRYEGAVLPFVNVYRTQKTEIEDCSPSNRLKESPPTRHKVTLGHHKVFSLSSERSVYDKHKIAIFELYD
jgi:hypothetical protein